MSNISERTTVHCSVNQAARHLTRYFAARGNSEGDSARVHLRAEVPIPGVRGGVGLERTAIATLSPSHTPGDMLPHYAVTWLPEMSGPYPRFAGTLSVAGDEDYDSFDLVLEGSYQPPLGAVGVAFDAVVGHRIAQSTARNLLATIADSIEADFRDIESVKAASRERRLETQQSPRDCE
ncbi:MAG: hypothetical protein NVS3B17_23490 [Vulcanimicrobiaceae bacterium]